MIIINCPKCKEKRILTSAEIASIGEGGKVVMTECKCKRKLIIRDKRNTKDGLFWCSRK